MDLPAGLSARAATVADAPAVLGLVTAAQLVDVGEPLLDLADIEADWASPGIELADDVVLVHDGGDLVAWAQVWESRADSHVHPAWRGRGIGAALVRWTEERALAAGAPGAGVSVGQTVPATLTAASSLFERRGYERRWDSWILRLPPGVAVTTPSPPDGLTIRAYRPEEEHRVYTVVDDAFSEWPGRDSRPFDDWQSRLTARPDFDPSLLLVATVDDRIVGAASGIHYPGEGWVDQIAVEAEHRGRGIARLLLAELFDRFRARGEQRIGLNTDSRTGALGLYLGLGMVVEHTFTHWSVVLREAAGP